VAAPTGRAAAGKLRTPVKATAVVKPLEDDDDLDALLDGADGELGDMDDAEIERLIAEEAV
jgi:hypothetical protein